MIKDMHHSGITCCGTRTTVTTHMLKHKTEMEGLNVTALKQMVPLLQPRTVVLNKVAQKSTTDI